MIHHSFNYLALQRFGRLNVSQRRYENLETYALKRPVARQIQGGYCFQRL